MLSGSKRGWLCQGCDWELSQNMPTPVQGPVLVSCVSFSARLQTGSHFIPFEVVLLCFFVLKNLGFLLFQEQQESFEIRDLEVSVLFLTLQILSLLLLKIFFTN